MAQRRIDVEVPVVDPLADRTVTQQIDYLAKPGHPITKRKTDTMHSITEGVANVVADALGFEVVHVSTKRQ